MKGGTVQILWHGSDPILSVDFHLPTGLLATAGADRDIKLWSLHRLEKSKALPSATFKANLSYHSAAVNVLRFSPSGELLASGADNGELLIWRITEADEEIPSWKVWKTLRFHHKDVLDLGWSPDGIFLVSGSVDNTCIIWNVIKGTVEQVFADHQHYVQGVTWDPVGKYVASLSGDRTCRIYSLQHPTKKSKTKEKNLKGVYTCQHILCKNDTSAASAASAGVAAVILDEAPQKQVSSSKQYLFYDENMPSFFRRLSWSPDGSFLLIPSGVEKQSPEASPCSVSYIVSRNDLSRPALQLPAGSKPVVAARFCPVIYSLCPKKSWKHDTNVPGVGAFKLPYRLVFAVATLNSVYIYDTEQSCPIAIFGGLHYAPITDLAWSSDAKFLAVSSQDGYCTLVGFDEGDLGSPMLLTDPSLLPDSRLANIQENSSVLSLPRGTSEKGVDVPLLEPAELVWKMSPPVKVPVAGTDHSPILSSGKSAKIQGRPNNIRKVNPKPISEYLHKSTVSIFNASVPTLDSGTLDLREDISPGPRCDQNTAETPLHLSNIPVVQLDLVRCRVDTVERLDAMQESSEVSNRSKPGIISPCQAVGKEVLLQSCVAMKGVNTEICRDAENHERSELSRNDQKGVAESAQGPKTPLCQEHGIGLGVNPPNSQKPRDQYSDIYVRPLKFRRISPNLVPNDLDKKGILKPLTSETSLALSNGL